MHESPVPKLYPLYTAGYTGIRPDDLLRTARALGALVADIRLSPRSRNPLWNQKKLQETLGERYVYLPDLGNLNYKGGYGQGIVIADMDSGASRLEAILQRQPVIILCACADYRTCHRKTVADYMATWYGARVVHLSAADIGRYGAGEQPILP